MNDASVNPSKPVQVPTFDELMWPTLQALRAMGGSATNEELLAKVIELESYSPEVQAFQHSDNRQTKLNYNLAWAKTYLKKDGAIQNSSRGVWSLTKDGEQLTVEDIVGVPSRVRKQVADKKRAKEPPLSEENPAADIEAEEVEATEPHWKDQLLSVLRAVAPDAFERLAQRLLREAGFLKVAVTGRSGDGGIDGIGVLRVNLLSFQVLFQCKRYQGSVGAGAIRDFRGAMVGRSDKGLMITTGTFTPDAKREATRDGAPAIDLIDGDQLCDLLKQLKLGVTTEMVEKMTVELSWFDGL
jgi:restriction system protein